MTLQEQIEKKREELAVLNEQQTTETLKRHIHFAGKCFRYSSARCVYIERILSATPMEVHAMGVIVNLQKNQTAFHANYGITINLLDKPTEITFEEFQAFVKISTDRITDYLEVINK